MSDRQLSVVLRFYVPTALAFGLACVIAGATTVSQCRLDRTPDPWVSSLCLAFPYPWISYCVLLFGGLLIVAGGALWLVTRDELHWR